MAGAGGFEPPVSGPEPGALPLGDAPIVQYFKEIILYMNHKEWSIFRGFKDSRVQGFKD